MIISNHASLPSVLTTQLATNTQYEILPLILKIRAIIDKTFVRIESYI